MARYQHLSIWRDANCLLILIEQAVRGFPRDHKYTLGSDLRRQATLVCCLIIRANNTRAGCEQELERLILAVEDMKVLTQLGKELEAFKSFKVFLQAAE